MSSPMRYSYMPSQNIDQLHGIDLYNCLPQIHHVERTCLYESIVRQLNIISNLDHSLDLLCVFALRIMIRRCHHYTIKPMKSNRLSAWSFIKWPTRTTNMTILNRENSKSRVRTMIVPWSGNRYVSRPTPICVIVRIWSKNHCKTNTTQNRFDYDGVQKKW